MSRSSKGPPGLLWLLTVAVLVELFALRTTTRTLIHIPGTDRFEVPIRVLAEGGRLAYYIAAVSLIVWLTVVALVGLRSRTPRLVVVGAATIVFLITAAAGRLDALPWTAVAWTSLALLVVAGLAGWQGVRSLPVGLFLVSSVAAGWSVLGQTTGEGLTGPQVDLLIWIAEFFLVLTGLAAPLLLQRAPSLPAMVVGAATALMVAGAFIAGASTISILVLWNVGVPGWLPGIAYALAGGTLMATLWSAARRAEWSIVIGLALLAAGGVGMISTYQTGLVLAGLVLLGGLGDVLLQAEGSSAATVDPIRSPDRLDGAATAPPRTDGLPAGAGRSVFAHGPRR